jgi:cytochrome b subunit of formate dehydrogenase
MLIWRVVVFLGTLVLIDGTVLFARNDLAEMPELQQKLMKLVVWVSFMADVSLSHLILNHTHIRCADDCVGG